MSDFKLTIKSFPRDPAKLVAYDDRKARVKLNKTMHRINKSILRKVLYNINGRILHRRSSKLYRSFGETVTRIKDGYRGTTFSDLVYSKIHDTGGMAGRNHATRIPKRSYFRKAVVERAPFIRKQLLNYMAEIVK